MNEQDLDLILALASGSLSGQDAAAAQARVDADPELAQELATQRAAIEASSATAPVAMTTDESSALRSELMTELHLDASPTPAAAPAKRAMPWWQPVLGFGAAAVLVVTIIVGPGLLGDSDAQFDQAALPESTTVASAETAETDETRSAAGGSEEQSADASVDGSALFDLVSGELDADDLAGELEVAGVSSLSSEKMAGVDSCLDQMADQINAERFVPLGSSDTDPNLVYLGAAGGQGIDSVLTIDLSDCTIVSIDK
ncbi:MAG: hypothetical protein ACR2N2_10140 [Acidimicrobiia bacterium]